MRRAAEPFSPWIADVDYERSIFVVKVIPPGRDRDDARPILISRQHGDSPIVSVLGSKLDNVYDFLRWLKTAVP